MIKDLKPSLNQNEGSEKLSFVTLEFMHVCDLRLSEITHGLTLARCTVTADCRVNTLESGSLALVDGVTLTLMALKEKLSLTRNKDWPYYIAQKELCLN